MAVIFYIGMAAFTWLFAESLIFQPPPASYQDHSEIIKIHTSDQEQLSAIYLENPSADYAILYSHGNAIDLGQLHPILLHIKQMGFSVFAYDYRGYGTSTGSSSEAGSYIDAEAAYKYLRDELNLPADKIIALGQSVGGGVATELATRKPLGGLILESTFVTAYRVMTKKKLLPFDQYENIRKIDSVTCPVLVIHGTQDGVVSFWHGKQLFEAAKDPKQAYWVEGAGHNNLLNVAGNKYKQKLKQFVDLIENT